MKRIAKVMGMLAVLMLFTSCGTFMTYIDEATGTTTTTVVVSSGEELCFVDEDGQVLLRNEHVEKAEAIWTSNGDSPNGSPILALQITLTSEGQGIMVQASRDNLGKTITITLGGEVVMSPTVNDPLDFREVIISDGEWESYEDLDAIAYRINAAVAK